MAHKHTPLPTPPEETADAANSENVRATQAADPEERALRPKRLSDYVGQAQLRQQLHVYLRAAVQRADALDHVLFSGPPGLGKTTLAHVLAAELGVQLRSITGPVLEKPGDLAVLLTQLQPRDILFIDEIHRLPAAVEEVLYSAMEDFQLDILIGEGAQTKTVTLPLAPFTLVGATTRAGSLSAPLRDRFGIHGRLEFYTPEELATVARNAAARLGVDLEPAASALLGERARGTPRLVLRLLRRVRDYSLVYGTQQGLITEADVRLSLRVMGVFAGGLDMQDRRMLEAIVRTHGGGPVGLETLSAQVGEAADTLEYAIEPYLLQQGLIARTPRGRVVTDTGRAQLAAMLQEQGA